MMHRRVKEYSREQTHGEREREILRLKNVRVKTSLASGVTVVSRRTCRTFRTFDMFWIDFRTRRMKRAGACWTRERDSARFADGRNFCLKKGLSVCSSLGKSSSLSHSSRSLVRSLSASHTRAFRALFAAEKNYDETPLCSSFYPTLTKPFPFLLTGYRSRSWRPQQKDEAHFAKVRKRLLGVVGETLPFPREKNGL